LIERLKAALFSLPQVCLFLNVGKSVQRGIRQKLYEQQKSVSNKADHHRKTVGSELAILTAPLTISVP
jgi:hypothetical protein